MPRYDFISQRLYVDQPLERGESIELDRGQSNYLLNVLRFKDGASVLVFNGRDGEWQAHVKLLGRKKAELKVVSQSRSQPAPYQLHYLFAPIKQARMEYMIQKAVEMGAGVLQPALTEFCQVRKLNPDRMRAHAIEAAEQCGILAIPEIQEPIRLEDLLIDFPEDRQLIFCDEGEETQNPLNALGRVGQGPYSVLIGPEGGFSSGERELLRKHPSVTAIPLGPRVLRADTAAVAALALVQSVLGDWNDD